jgi:hypothetical protein
MTFLSELVQFWYRCVVEGHSIGSVPHNIIAAMVGTIGGFYLWWRKKKPASGGITWGEVLGKWATALLVVSCVVSIVVVAPYLQYSKMKRQVEVDKISNGSRKLSQKAINRIKAKMAALQPLTVTIEHQADFRLDRGTLDAIAQLVDLFEDTGHRVGILSSQLMDSRGNRMKGAYLHVPQNADEKVLVAFVTMFDELKITPQIERDVSGERVHIIIASPD